VFAMGRLGQHTGSQRSTQDVGVVRVELPHSILAGARHPVEHEVVTDRHQLMLSIDRLPSPGLLCRQGEREVVLRVEAPQSELRRRRHPVEHPPTDRDQFVTGDDSAEGALRRLRER
jgi:hypothetical protein